MAEIGYRIIGDVLNARSQNPTVHLVLRSYSRGVDGAIQLSAACMSEQEIDGAAEVLRLSLKKSVTNAKRALKTKLAQRQPRSN